MKSDSAMRLRKCVQDLEVNMLNFGDCLPANQNMKAPDHVKWGVLAKNPMSATGGSSLNSSDGGFRFNSEEKCVRRDVHEQCGKKARTKLYTKTNSKELLGSKIEKRPRQ